MRPFVSSVASMRAVEPPAGGSPSSSIVISVSESIMPATVSLPPRAPFVQLLIASKAQPLCDVMVSVAERLASVVVLSLIHI